MENSETNIIAEKSTVGVCTRIRRFIQEVSAELGRCVWPTRSELIETTIAVIVMVLLLSVFVFGLDQGFRFLFSSVLHIS